MELEFKILGNRDCSKPQDIVLEEAVDKLQHFSGVYSLHKCSKRSFSTTIR